MSFTLRGTGCESQVGAYQYMPLGEFLHKLGHQLLLLQHGNEDMNLVGQRCLNFLRSQRPRCLNCFSEPLGQKKHPTVPFLNS